MAFGPGLEGLPELLTVDEAAQILRIGRSLAHLLANRFLDGDTCALPVIRVGRCLRVPRWALAELIRYGRVVGAVDPSGSLRGEDRAQGVSTATPSHVGVVVSLPTSTNAHPKSRASRRPACDSQLSLAIES